MSYDLRFEIDPELYQRAVTTPLDGPVSKDRRALYNIAAMVLFPASIFCFNRALFAPDALVAMCFAAVFGAGMVLVVWWRQHGRLVKHHKAYNETGGTQEMTVGPDGIKASRPMIRSEIDWGFVRAVRGIDGASLIELPTARLIVPDAALPEGVTQASFVEQLESWRTA
ncbi:hypothetical protein KO498_08590 [Lentibacter algarum]|uniref:hypothetical protein n=1 Tax=Lentibacter algarum TaxID=576131 RepID=UPI001C06EA6C|nr:hypothetical protein [Lentibacter algarum]MBU2981871.1 hypothetical protein [Lentibacter algarum]